MSAQVEAVLYIFCLIALGYLAGLTGIALTVLKLFLMPSVTLALAICLICRH